MPEQVSLFHVDSGGPPQVERVDLPDADIVFLPDFFRSPDRDWMQADLDETTIWRQEALKMYGREIPTPRLTAWHGDAGKSYTYSKITMHPEPWTTPLSAIKAAVETEVGVAFNGVLLNLYRDGSDSMAWHSDDEPELGADPVIASVSFGSTRKFQFRHKSRPDLRHEMELTHGSLLVMRGSTQRHWQHQIPKTSRHVGPRINLTFRHID